MIASLLRRYYFPLVAFYIGFASAIGQVLLIRELLTIFRGNEFIIGIIFTGWFLGVFFGARLNSIASHTVLEKRVVVSYIAFPIVLLLFVHFVHLIPLFFRKTAENFFPLTAEFALSFFFTVPVSFFVGYFFPPLVTLYAQHAKEKSGGIIYLVESFGAFVGGILFSFVFIEVLNPLSICAILIAFAVCIYIALFGKRKIGFLLLIPLLIFYYSADIEQALFRYVWNRTQASTLLRYDRTKYQTIFLGYNDQQISVYGDGVLYYTIPDRYEIRPLFHFIQALRNGKKNEELILFGSGPGSLPYNLLRTDISTLAYFEIDPKLYRTIEPYRIRFYKTGPEDNRLAVIAQDIRYFLKNSQERFHMIICFPPPPHNANLNRYYTKEFYSMCKNRLKPEGIFITSLSGFSSALETEQRDYLASIYRSFSSVFPYHIITSGDVMYLVGVNGDSSILNPEKIINNYAKRLQALKNMPIERSIIEDFSPSELSILFEPTRIEYFQNTVVRTASVINENTDRLPYAYWRYILHSAAKERSLLYVLLKNYEYFLFLLLLATVLVHLLVLKKHGIMQCVGGFLIYAVGMVSMVGIVIMIILYQNFYGVVYYRISLINALFMLGLTLGSLIATKFNIRSLSKVKFGILSSLACLFIFIHTQNEVIFWLVLIAFATFCGIVFPALFSMLSRDDYQTTASNLDSMEFFGSIIGSVGTTVILPIVGVEALLIAVMVLLIISIGVSRMI